MLDRRNKMDKQTTVTATAAEKEKKEHNIHILDLGTRKRSAIRDLENGTGRLMNEVERVIDDLPKDKGNHVVVVICKRKRRKGGKSSYSFNPLNPLSMLRC
jgi:hypothetical protein